MTIQIEKNIPTPPISGRGNPCSYPFAQMAVGDSFAVPLSGEKDKRGTDRVAGSLSVSAAYYRKQTGHQYTLRTLKDEGIVRCWRVS